MITTSRAYWAAYRAVLTDAAQTRTVIDYVGAVRSGSYLMADEMTRAVLARDQQNLPKVPWEELPETSRIDLQSAAQTRGKRGSIVKTGGSTGTPVSVVLTKKDFRGKRSRLMAARQIMGWRPGMSLYGIWGSSLDAKKSTLSRIQEKMSGITIDSGFTSDKARWRDLHEELNSADGAVAIYGYTSLMSQFAQWCVDNDARLTNVAVSWNGAEPLDEVSRERIHNGFGVNPLDFYGTRETGALAIELSSRKLIALGPEVILQVVDSNGHMVDEGQAGRVLVSLPSREGTPILRYEIGDLAIAGRRGEFGHLWLEELQGRIVDSIPLPDGRLVSGAFFPHSIKDFSAVSEAQLHVNVELRTATIKVVRRGGDSLDGLVNVTTAEIPGYRVNLEFVTEIPRTMHGKLRQVVVK